MVVRVGLVLGSGGATGAAFHAGMLEAIRETTGWDGRLAELIIGTSAGSITGASLRAGLSPSDLFSRACDLPVSPDGQRIIARVPPEERGDPEFGAAPRGPAAKGLLASYMSNPRSMRLGGLAAAALPEGKVATAGISAAMGAICENRWPDEPLWVVAMRLPDGQRMVYGRDAEAPIGLAIAASCAIPGYFQPVEINGVPHVDGGMYSACNLDLMADLGLDLVIVSAPMSTHSPVAKTLDLPFRQFLRHQLEVEAAAVRRSGTKVVVFAPTRADLPIMGINPMAPGREESVAQQVLESVTERVQDGALLAELAIS